MGVQSDVGGGNINTSQSNISLGWMIDHTIDSGVPINRTKAKKERYVKQDAIAKISENKDVKRDKRRKQLPGDRLQASAMGKKLAVSESHTCIVHSELKYNWSGVELEEGCCYEFIVDATQRWKDSGVDCGPNGWKSEQLPWFKEEIVEFLEKKRRHPKKTDWFEDFGALGDENEELLRILSDDKTYMAPRDAELYFFANDLASKYGNNNGSMNVSIKRIS